MKNDKNLEDADEKKLQEDMKKQLSPKRAFMRIIIAIFAFLWFLVGGSAQTVLSLSGGAMGLSGIVSYLIRNPVSFLLIAFINVIFGVYLFLFALSYAFLIFIHFLWSIRWFYGYFKYRKLQEGSGKIKKMIDDSY
jgi:uncharacterized membrane protein